MRIDKALLNILACPLNHGAPLVELEEGAALRCPECESVFPVHHGIPVLLPQGFPRKAALEFQPDDSGNFS